MQVIPRYRRSSIVAAEGGTPAHHLGPGVARRRRHQAIPAEGGTSHRRWDTRRSRRRRRRTHHSDMVGWVYGGVLALKDGQGADRIGCSRMRAQENGKSKNKDTDYR